MAAAATADSSRRSNIHWRGEAFPPVSQMLLAKKFPETPQMTSRQVLLARFSHMPILISMLQKKWLHHDCLRPLLIHSLRCCPKNSTDIVLYPVLLARWQQDKNQASALKEKESGKLRVTNNCRNRIKKHIWQGRRLVTNEGLRY